MNTTFPHHACRKVDIGRNVLFSTFLLLLAATPLSAQGTQADYDRAAAWQSRVRDKVLRQRVEPHWLDDGRRFWYRVDVADGGREYVFVDAAAGTRQLAFDHAQLAKALSDATGKPHTAAKLSIDLLDLMADGTILLQAAGKPWQFTPSTQTLQPSQPLEAPTRRNPSPSRRLASRQQTSPDGRWTVRVQNQNLYLRSKESGEERQLTNNGSEENEYEGGVYWSPDPKYLVAMQTNKGGRRLVYLVESSPKDQLQPKLHSYSYLKPGDPIPQTKPHLFDVEEAKEIAVKDDLFANPWSLNELRWEPDSSRFTFLYNQRGHQVMRVVSVAAATGLATAIVDEQCATFFDYAYKKFTHYLPETQELVWMSERDGWNHLYLVDMSTGQVKNQITSGEWVVRKVERVDEEARQVWFQASGIHAGQDPYFIHHARINFDGSGLVVFTSGDGDHKVQFSPDQKYVIDTYSRVDLPPVTELRKTEDGSLVVELERADASPLLAAGWRPPQRFVAKGRDGKTDIYGVIHRPSNHDPKLKYPVIENIYAGPHGSFVPKQFSPYYSSQALAELGFIVVQIDGMGTSNRSKAFHDVAWKNLGDSGFPDRMLWMKAAAAEDESFDLTRVGIYGGSAGGQSALRAMLAHGDFYHAAVADCGCHDNRMDKIWWNELWMSWPIGPHYVEQSNVTQAHRLQGKLLLVVGELDRNVDPSSTMQVVNALIKADKDFDLLVVPGGGHGIAESAYGKRRRSDFFVRHLLHVEPRQPKKS